MENYRILDGWQSITIQEAQLDEEGNELVSQMKWKTVTTEVEFYLDKGTAIIEVSHFMPKDDADIIRGLDNRYNSENKK